MGYWIGLTLGLLGALIVGLAIGVDRDPAGRYAMAVIAALTLVAGIGVLWENGPAGEPRRVRVLRVMLWLLPIFLFLLCRVIALTAP
jgi:drug/metabolite transporter (DMT)-like permease